MKAPTLSLPQDKRMHANLDSCDLINHVRLALYRLANELSERFHGIGSDQPISIAFFRSGREQRYLEAEVFGADRTFLTVCVICDGDIAQISSVETEALFSANVGGVATRAPLSYLNISAELLKSSTSFTRLTKPEYLTALAEYANCILSTVIDAATSVYAYTLNFAANRKTTNSTLIALPSVRNQLADVYASLEICKTSLDASKNKTDEVTPIEDIHSALVVLKKSKEMADSCVQLCGGWGYIQRNPVAIFYRDISVIDRAFRFSILRGVSSAESKALEEDRSVTVKQSKFSEKFDQFLEQEIGDKAQLWDSVGAIPHAVFRRFGECGYLGQVVPTSWGGRGESFLRHVEMVEVMMRREYFAVAISMMLVANTVAPVLVRYASERIKERYLNQIIRGEMIASLAVTEIGSAGSMLTTLETVAVDCGDHWEISGSKHYITNAPAADIALVLARTAYPTDESGIRQASGLTLFCVPMRQKSVVIVEKYQKLGAHGSETGHIRFTNCRVEKDCHIGLVGSGLVYVVDLIVEERLLIACAAVAYASQVAMRLRDGIPDARVRRITDEILGEARLLRRRCWYAARLVAERRSISTEAAMLKYLCGDFAKRAVGICEDIAYEQSTDRDLLQWIQNSKMNARVLSLFTGASGVMQDYFSRRVVTSAAELARNPTELAV